MYCTPKTLSFFKLIAGLNLQDPLPVIKKVEKFLGIDSFFSKDHFIYPNESKFPCFRPSPEAKPMCMKGDKGRKHPDLAEDTYQTMKQYFEPRMKEFFNLTGIKYEL